MLQPVSTLSGSTYRHAVKPVLFKFKPDDVHHATTSAGKLAQSLPPLRGAIHGLYAYHHPSLETDVAGLHFRNPVGLSAGFDKNFELAPLMKAFGFGQMEGGSLTYEPCPGNPRPWFYRLPKSKALVVYAGLGNQGSERIIKRIQDYNPNLFRDFPLNISVAPTNTKDVCDVPRMLDDYLGSLRRIKKAGVGQLITLNVSCPNTYGGEPFSQPANLRKLLTAVEALKLKQPIFLKMPCDLDWKDFSKMIDVAAEHSVTGLTMVNLAKDRKKMQLQDPLPDSVKGNMGGMPTKSYSDMVIEKTRRTYGQRFVIIGVGGIFSAEDAWRKITLGADMVELITGMIFEGPQLIGQINLGLAQRLKRYGYTHISDAVGTAL